MHTKRGRSNCVVKLRSIYPSPTLRLFLLIFKLSNHINSSIAYSREVNKLYTSRLSLEKNTVLLPPQNYTSPKNVGDLQQYTYLGNREVDTTSAELRPLLPIPAQPRGIQRTLIRRRHGSFMVAEIANPLLGTTDTREGSTNRIEA